MTELECNFAIPLQRVEAYQCVDTVFGKDFGVSHALGRVY